MLWFLLGAMLAPQADGLSVLIFSKSAPYRGRDFEYRHEAIPEGTAAIRAIGAREGWTVEATEDASRFNDETLARFDVVVFLLTTGDVLNDDEQAALERFIRSGKGYVGIHSASDTEHAWPWYRGARACLLQGPPAGPRSDLHRRNPVAPGDEGLT